MNQLVGVVVACTYVEAGVVVEGASGVVDG